MGVTSSRAHRHSVQGLDIRDYVRGNSDLTATNFEEAFLAAKADAYTKTVPFANGGATYDLVVPPGHWRFSRKVQFPGVAAYDRASPGIRGAGMLRTVFVFPHDLNDACFEFGNPTADGWSWFSTLEGFSVVPDPPSAGMGIGIRSYVGMHQTFRDVQCAGWIANQHYESGCGFKITGNASFGNAQHLYMDRCQAAQCQTGFYFDDIWPSTLIDLNANQCSWVDAVVDRCIGMAWVGGNLQSSSDPALKNSFWFGGVTTPCIVSGWGATSDFNNNAFGSGTGATLAAASRDGRGYGTSHVTGLAGLTSEDQYRWLVLSDPSYTGPAYPNTDFISGIYIIEQVISASECIISKGTAHAIRTGLSWSIRGTQGGNYLQLTHYPYHEGVKRALVLGLRDHKTSSHYALRGVFGGDLDAVAEAHGVLGRVSVHEVARAWAPALKCTSVVQAETDAQFSTISVDDYTREALICRGRDLGYGAGAGLYQGAYSQTARLNSFCRERGALAVWDARQGVTKSGTDVSVWTDFISGAQLVPKAAGHFPQFVASDANFGGQPVIQCVAGTPQGSLFVGKIPAEATPSRPFLTTLVCVCRVPDPVLFGSAATVSAFSGGVATLTGLSGMTAAQVGKVLNVSNANTAGNNGAYVIASVVSSTSVKITNPNASSTDTHNGSLAWRVYPNTLRHVWITEADGATPPGAVPNKQRITLGMYDNSNGEQIWGAIWTNGMRPTPTNITHDAQAHAYLLANSSRAGAVFANEAQSLPPFTGEAPLWPAKTPIFVGVADGYYGQVCSDLHVAYLAVFPWALCLSEQAQLFDLAANEFKLAR